MQQFLCDNLHNGMKFSIIIGTFCKGGVDYSLRFLTLAFSGDESEDKRFKKCEVLFIENKCRKSGRISPKQKRRSIF